MTSSEAATSVRPMQAGKPKRASPQKKGQPSKLSQRAKDAIARTKAFMAGAPATPREVIEPPKNTPHHPAGTLVKFTEDARKKHGWRQREMTVIECDCPMCRDNRWVAVDRPAMHDPKQKQHYASAKLRRAGKDKPAPEEE